MKIRLRKSYIYVIISVAVILIAISVYFFVFYSKTVAVVDGMKIKQKEVDTYVDFLKSQDATGQVASDKEQLKILEANIIDSLIVVRVIEKYADENDLAVTGEEVNEQMKSIIDTYESEKDFEEALEELGVNKKFLEDELRSQILRSRIYDKVTYNVAVTDEEVEQYYEDNKDTLFLVPRSVKAAHILAMFPWVLDNSEETGEGREEARKKIELVETELKSGSDFEELAGEYSDDESTAENGGDLGYVSEGQMVEEFEEALFSLGIGEVSDIVETDYGFHIIKVYDIEEEHIQEFEEVKESVSIYLLNLYKGSKWEDFIFSLIEEADIKYLTGVEGTLNDTDTGKEDE